jgi:mannose-6-phosphate isomerase-like protein (cupin superfamily)
MRMYWKSIHRLAAGLTALALLSPAGAASAEVDGAAFHRSAGELRAAVAQTKDGLAVSALPTGAATVVMVRRDRTGEVELHMGQNDVFVAHDGHAVVIIGDKVTGNREVSPGEWRGGTLSGAQRHPMAAGDVLWIPAGLPHQVVPAAGGFNYVAFKYPSARKP